MAEKKKAAVIGDVFVDMVAEIEGFPERGGRSYGVPLSRRKGGTAGNIAAGLATLGVKTAIAAGVGDDKNGDYIIQGLEEDGVETRHIQRKKGLASGATAIFTDPEGERNIYVLVKGSAFERIEKEDIEFLEEFQPDAICFTGVVIGSHPAEETACMAAREWKGRAKLYFDPNLCYPADRVPENIKKGTQALAELCDVVLTGETEMKALELKPRKDQMYIVKCGARGSKLLDEEGRELFCIPATHHKPVDTTGAGDTYMAAFVAARSEGRGMREAMEYASVAAGISVTRKGARNMPSPEEIKEGMKEYEKGEKR